MMKFGSKEFIDFYKSLNMSLEPTIEDSVEEVEFLLEKSVKYLKRAGVPGNYKYWYDTPNKKEFNAAYKLLGQEIKHTGDVKKTLEDIFRKKGHAKDVFKINYPIVDIDPKTNKKFAVKNSDGSLKTMKVGIDMIYGNHKAGLFHMAEKHYAKRTDYQSLDDLQNAIISSIKEMQLADISQIKYQGQSKFIFKDSKGNLITFGAKDITDSKGRQMVTNFIITSYDNMNEGTHVRNRSNEDYLAKMDEINNYK